MNSLETLVDLLITHTIRASILVVGILFIQWLFRHRLTPTWHYALWLPLLAAVVLPTIPILPAWLADSEEPVNREQALATTTVTAAEAEITTSMPLTSDSVAPAYPEASIAPPAQASPIAIKPAIAILWVTGASGLLTMGLLGYYRNMRRIRLSSTKPDAKLQAVIDRAAEEAGLKRAPLTWVSPAVNSPAVAGFTCPVLLLPATFSSKLDASEVRLVLLHEFSHIKRFDLPLNCISWLLLCAHWFNPLIWFAVKRMRIDREKACDASVLAIDAGSRVAEYGKTLLKLQLPSESRTLAVGFVGLFQGDTEIKSRIRQIAAYRPGGSFSRIGGIALISLLTVMCTLKVRSAESGANSESETPAATEVSTEATEPASPPEAEKPAEAEEEMGNLTPNDQILVQKFINRVKTGNRAEIAEGISYPLRRDHPIDPVNNKQELIKRFNEVFDAELMKQISNSDPETDWVRVGWRGIMLDDGRVWLDDNGKVSAINHQPLAEKLTRAKIMAKQKLALHPSVRKFAEPILEWKTKSHIVRIDNMDDNMANAYRLTLWPIKNKTSDKPEIILMGGSHFNDGNGGNHYYEFVKGKEKYVCRITVIGAPDSEPQEFEAYDDDKLLWSEPGESIVLEK